MVWRQAKVILRVCLIKSAPAADDALSLQISCRIGAIVDEVVIGGVADGLRGESVTGVVQPDPADLGAELQSVAAAHQAEVVDIGKGRAHLGIERGSVDAIESSRRDKKRRGAIPPGAVVGAV